VPHPSRTQLVAYVAVAVVALLLGARWIRASDASTADSAAVAPARGGPGVEIRGEGGGAVVHVAGEVRKPGVYRLAAGSRVADALKRAGGATARAALDAINLAARLADGQQVVVPARAGAGGAQGAITGSTDGPISLGTATAEQLDQIEGIGEVTAQKIIEFRDRHGGLASIEQLDEIPGIGPATMEALRARLQP
jgi:competence protein ComEA